MKTAPVLYTLTAWLAVTGLAGCMSASQHYQQTHGAQEREMTVGVVQKEVRMGMSAAEVAEVLGSPNIVTGDGSGGEAWIYDRISTDVTYSNSSGGAGVALLFGAAGGDAFAGGLPHASYGQSAGSQSKTQRTLTVVIKFDEQKRVRDFSYHSSRF